MRVSFKEMVEVSVDRILKHTLPDNIPSPYPPFLIFITHSINILPMVAALVTEQGIY